MPCHIAHLYLVKIGCRYSRGLYDKEGQLKLYCGNEVARIQ